MKNIIIGVVLCLVSLSSMAEEHWHHHYYEGHRGSGFGWIAPLAIGGFIGYELARPPVVVSPPPVVMAPPTPVYVPVQPATRFYCPSAQAYYPSVQLCDQPWLQVVQ